MKAYEIQGSFGLSQLKLVERSEPELGPRDVLIRMSTLSLNYRDYLMVTGQYNSKQTLPLIPISDGVGEVIRIGCEVHRVKVGDRVAGNLAQNWISGPIDREKAKMILGGSLDGMLAELVSLPEQGVVKVPDHLSDIEAATLPCAATTAWRALIVESQVKAGDSVLVQGTGGVSLFALAFAKMSGARVIVLSGSEHKLERALALGADAGINRQVTPEWSHRVRDLSGGRGVDIVIDVGGASTISQSIQALRVGGQINLIGQLGGGQDQVNWVPFFMRNIRVQGILVGSRENFEDMNRAIALHRMRPQVDRVFPFPKIHEALTYLAEGRHFGKICVQIS